MHYISTRGTTPPACFSDILLEGLASDGGLAIPEHYPQLSQTTLEQWRHFSYQQLAEAVIALYATDIPQSDLTHMISRAYTAEKFGSMDIAPLITLAPNLHLLGLSNGPTLAFKDMAMQFLGEVFEYVLEKRQLTLNIVGATSGDTGSSAEYAMCGKSRVNVFMLSPLGKMSPFQTAQMFSLQQPNIFNLAVDGVFDDCQDLVKALANDLVFKKQYRIGAVNSINWARIVAQVVYYFKGYYAATTNLSQVIDVVVPSGNFGNIFAGYIARKMGLPIRRLILATNENNVLDEFFKTGRYRVRASQAIHATSSPSMDIGKASNFERFICDLVGPVRTAQLWSELAQTGQFDLSADPIWETRASWGIDSGCSTHSQRLAMIKQVHQQYQVMIDPHTADGMHVGLALRESDVPLICLETALPAKFESTITEALGMQAPRPAQFDHLEQLPQRFEVMHNDAATLKEYVRLHT